MDPRTEQKRDEIAALFQECFFEAGRQGFTGTAEEWEATKEDVEWVEERIGYKLGFDDLRSLKVAR
jgi:hypothetical protein